MNSHELAQKLLALEDSPVFYMGENGFIKVGDFQLMDSKDLPAAEDKNTTEEQLGFPPKLICLLGTES